MSQALSNVFKLKDVINVKDPAFGAKGDGVTNDAVAIQAAIDAAEAVGGGIVLLGPDVYGVGSTIYVDDDCVTVLGQGGGGAGYADNAVNNAAPATTLKWIGATGSGPIIKFTSDRVDVGNSVQKSGGGLRGVFLHCDLKATIGLEIQTWHHGIFEDIHVAYARTFGYKIWTLTGSMAPFSGVQSCQHNLFQNLTYTEPPSNANNPIGFILGSGKAGFGNISMNVFINIRARMRGSGAGFVMEDSDMNMFYFLRSDGVGGGDSGKIILHADDTGQLSKLNGNSCRGNMFFGVEAVSGITNKATVAGIHDARFNVIYGLSRGNAAPRPVIESPSVLTYHETASGGLTGDKGGSWLGGQPRGVFVRRAVVQTIANATDTTVIWDREVYDTDDVVNIQAGVTTEENITVPSGTFGVRIFGQIQWAANAGAGVRRAWVQIDTGGGYADFNGQPDSYVSPVAEIGTNNFDSGELKVLPGNRFRVRVHQTRGGNLDITGGTSTWLKIQWL